MSSNYLCSLSSMHSCKPPPHSVHCSVIIGKYNTPMLWATHSHCLNCPAKPTIYNNTATNYHISEAWRRNVFGIFAQIINSVKIAVDVFSSLSVFAFVWMCACSITLSGLHQTQQAMVSWMWTIFLYCIRFHYINHKLWLCYAVGSVWFQILTVTQHDKTT